MTALRVRGLDVSLGTASGTRSILRAADLDVAAGELVAILGPSGAGKSVLLAALLGLSPVGARLSVDGGVAVDGQAAPPPDDPEWAPLRGRVIAWMPQQPGAALDPRQTAIAAVREALSALGGDPRAAATALIEAGLGDPSLHSRYPHQLSGGERQRLVLALALAGRPAVLLADEPTASLDPPLRDRLLTTLDQLRASRQLAVLVVTHDPAVAAHADRLLVLQAGTLTPSPTPTPPIPVRPDPPSRPTPKLRVAGLRVRRGDREVLRGIDLALGAGELGALIGGSGSGKSTLVAALSGRLASAAGTATLDDLDLLTLHPLDGPALPSARRRCQLIPQDAGASLDGRRTVAEHLTIAAAAHGLPLDAAALLSEVDLPPDVLPRRPHALSGGQRQRVAIARALAVRPDALLADEPTSALDPETRDRVLALLRRLTRSRGLSTLLVTHDLDGAASVADRAWVLDDGRIVEQGPAGALWSNPRHPVTRGLLGRP